MAYNSLGSLYNNVKENPKILIYKPWYFLFIPFLLYHYIKLRWNTIPETIFLTETYIKNHRLLEKRFVHNYTINIIENQFKVDTLVNNRIKEEPGLNKYYKEIMKRITRGDKIFVLEYKNKYMAYLFLSEKIADFTQVNHIYYLPEKCFSVFDVYTFEEYRGLGIYEILLSEVIKYMYSKGYERFWLWVMKHNQISVIVHENLMINHVIMQLTEYYRFGIRKLKKEKTDFHLRDLIQ